MPGLMCPKCNVKLLGCWDKFCSKCGTRGVPMPKCGWCGDLFLFSEKDKFCASCGRPREEAVNPVPESSIFTLVLNIFK